MLITLKGVFSLVMIGFWWVEEDVLEFQSVATAHHAKASATRASGGMADALASGASVLRDVGVQVPLRPQKADNAYMRPVVTNSNESTATGFLVSRKIAA